MEKQSSEEIDFYDLLIKSISFIKANLTIFLFFIAVALGVSVFLFNRAERTYEGRIVISSAIVGAPYFDKIIINVDKMIQIGNYTEASNLLKLTEVQISQIKHLRVQPLKTINLRGRDSVFMVTAEVSEAKFVAELQRGILEYFKNSEYVKTKSRERKEEYLAMDQRILHEIHFLDSVKKTILIPKGNASLLIADPGGISATVVDLYKKHFHYKNSLESEQDVQLLNGFSMVPNLPKYSLTKTILMGLAAGIFASLLFLSLRFAYRLKP